MIGGSYNVLIGYGAPRDLGWFGVRMKPTVHVTIFVARNVPYHIGQWAPKIQLSPTQSVTNNCIIVLGVTRAVYVTLRARDMYFAFWVRVARPFSIHHMYIYSDKVQK